MGVTRARVYQLLEECEQAIEVRWPQGRCLLTLLRQKGERHIAGCGGVRRAGNGRGFVFSAEFWRLARENDELSAANKS